MKINIVIPNYNGADLIKKNLPLVLKALKKYPDSVVTIVDDASDSLDKKELRKAIDTANFSSKIPVSLLEHEKNLGFSSTVNTGVNSSKSDIVVLLNSDVAPQEDFLENAVPLFKSEMLFGVGCLEKSIEKEKTVLRGSGKGVWKKGFLLHGEGDVNSGKTFWVSGGSAIFKTELYKKLDGMDALYNPFYWEDIDLSYRARKAGFFIAFSNSCVVMHKHDEGAIKQNFKKAEVNAVAYRNQFIFVWKNITDTSLLVSHFVWLPIHIVSAVLHGNKTFLKGFFIALSLLPAIIVQRKKQKLSYKISDRDVLANQ